MKNLFFISALLLSFSGFSQLDTVRLTSKISDVTVFFNGAEVNRSGKVSLAKGKHILLLNELPNSINEQSIQVEGFQKAKILSVKSQLAFYNSTHKSEEILQIEKKVKALQIDIQKINIQIDVYNIEEVFLLENSKLAGKEKTVSLIDLKTAAEFYRTKLLSIRNKIIDLRLSVEDKKDTIRDQYRLINKAISKKKQAYIQLFIAI
ncbi:MAG: DUF4140 domain-containing protein, partial [Flavobacteriales bacterium]|nr:DUF4140 domain-containing protein [Flavobacteriales bacterium]